MLNKINLTTSQNSIWRVKSIEIFLLGFSNWWYGYKRARNFYHLKFDTFSNFREREKVKLEKMLKVFRSRGSLELTLSGQSVIIIEKPISQELHNMMQYPDIAQNCIRQHGTWCNCEIMNMVKHSVIPKLHNMVQYQDMIQQVKSHKPYVIQIFLKML